MFHQSWLAWFNQKTPLWGRSQFSLLNQMSWTLKPATRHLSSWLVDQGRLSWRPFDVCLKSWMRTVELRKTTKYVFGSFFCICFCVSYYLCVYIYTYLYPQVSKTMPCQYILENFSRVRIQVPRSCTTVVNSQCIFSNRLASPRISRAPWPWKSLEIPAVGNYWLLVALVVGCSRFTNKVPWRYRIPINSKWKESKIENLCVLFMCFFYFFTCSNVCSTSWWMLTCIVAMLFFVSVLCFCP